MKVLEISIGIAAYNEEKNIKKVLSGILAQKEQDWKLKEIIVICDGCTDKTVAKAKEVESSFITVLDDGLRKGKTQRLNELFKRAKGEIIIMFDGDIAFSNKNVITNLITPFVTDKKVMLVGGNSRPFPPKTFVEKAVYSTFTVFYESRKKMKKGHNIFGATGSILAARRELVKDLKIPKVVSEDAYLYLYCLSKRHVFKYVDEAVIFYKLPKNFKDYVRQVLRSEPGSVTTEMYPHFGERAIKEFKRPFGFYVSNVLAAWINNPIGVTTIIIINILCKPLQPFVIKNYKLDWFTAHSTHN